MKNSGSVGDDNNFESYFPNGLSNFSFSSDVASFHDEPLVEVQPAVEEQSSVINAQAEPEEQAHNTSNRPQRKKAKKKHNCVTNIALC